MSGLWNLQDHTELDKRGRILPREPRPAKPTQSGRIICESCLAERPADSVSSRCTCGKIASFVFVPTAETIPPLAPPEKPESVFAPPQGKKPRGGKAKSKEAIARDRAKRLAKRNEEIYGTPSRNVYKGCF